ncbi:hypothetical protein Ccrd_019267 [Cynara cardunculus var. scolymus]|uniref:C3H1-type domain-containing protein n=1 Tax=Cynara cardunculus var. scolymus TaxID=59895 RepID=A0A103Y4Q4_CYNCS|nr:hypothetical protein Ccrd_019267 [Cynara cardunculus var. scolymus]
MATSDNNNSTSKIKFMWNNTNNRQVLSSPITVVDHHDHRLHLQPQNVGFESKVKSDVLPEGSGKSRAAAGGGGNGNSSMQTHQYPVRSDAKDCLFFVHTGSCSFGSSCRFNHPSPGEKICSFYMRTGLCGFGAACKFHHPEPVFIKGPKNRNPYASREAMKYTNGSARITNGGYIIQFPDSPQQYIATPMLSSSAVQVANFSSVAPAVVDAKNTADFPPLSRPLVLSKPVVELPKTSKPLVLNEVGLPMRPVEGKGLSIRER